MKRIDQPCPFYLNSMKQLELVILYQNLYSYVDNYVIALTIESKYLCTNNVCLDTEYIIEYRFTT